MEETIPLERNFVQARLRKEKKYADLKTLIELKGWVVYDHTFEVGALGFIAKTFERVLRSLGFVSKRRKAMRKLAAKIALRSSYYIWANRFNQEFLAPCLVPTPAENTPCINKITPVKLDITHRDPLSTLTKLRESIDHMTPVDIKK